MVIKIIEKFWYKAARTVIKAGNLPIAVSDTIITLLQTIMTEEQAKFIVKTLKKPSLNIDQIKAKSDLDDATLKKMLNDLMNNGIVVGLPSRRTGVMVYRLLGPFPGMFEYTLMKGETGEKQEKLAKLFDKFFHQVSEGTQKNYDDIIIQFEKIPPINRVVPVEEIIDEIPVDKVVPYEEVSKIVDKFDNRAQVHCYCRHQKSLLKDPCKRTNERENCFLLGKSAQFAIEHDFGKSISKKEVKKFLKSARDDGLVHKAFHIHLKPELDEEGICNCCKCCCACFSLYYRGGAPHYCYSSYLAKGNKDDCIGCGTCIEKCPMESIELEDDIAIINEEKCIGCGLCAYHCPEEAIHLMRTGLREVFVPPPKM